jgi:hypothetical protein
MNAEERSTLLTTLLRVHTTARRHCEAARRQQARVTAGGPSFDDRTRAGAEKFGPNQPPHRLHAPARTAAVPPGTVTGRCQKGACTQCTGGLHSAEACGVPHTVQFMRKMRKVCFTENRAHCLVYQKCTIYLLDQNDSVKRLSGHHLFNGTKRDSRTQVPRVL